MLGAQLVFHTKGELRAVLSVVIPAPFIQGDLNVKNVKPENPCVAEIGPFSAISLRFTIVYGYLDT